MKHCLSRSWRTCSEATWAGHERGAALLLVLWIITLLAVVCAEFSWTMRAELAAAQNFRDGEQVYYAAEAGLNRALMELMRGAARPRQTAMESATAGNEEEPLYWEPGSLRRFELGNAVCEVLIEDEGNKIEINTLLAKSEKDPASLKALLKKTFKLEGEELDIVADSLIDWHDKDANVTGVNGAEDDYYQSLEPPYRSRNGDIPVIEELLLVRGIDEALFFGPSRPELHEQKAKLTREELDTLVASSDQENSPETEEEGEEAAAGIGMADVFFATNPDLAGMAGYSLTTTFKVDVNTATQQQLLVLDGMTPATARQIVAEREVRRFDATTDPRLAGMAMYEGWKNQITVSAGKARGLYKITATGRSPDGRVSRSVMCTAVIQKNLSLITTWKTLN